MRRTIALIGYSLLLGTVTAFAQQVSKEQYRNADPKDVVKQTNLNEEQLSTIQRLLSV